MAEPSGDVAVAAARAARDSWERALRAQLEAGRSAEHGGFYALAAEVAGTLFVLEELAGLLSRQVTDYGRGRRLRDDVGMEPAERLGEAAATAAALRADLAGAGVAANRLWSQVGHIGLELDDEPGPTHTSQDEDEDGLGGGRQR